jgi:hypothetical protein
MKRVIIFYVIVFMISVLCISCILSKKNNNVLYPIEIEITPTMRNKLATLLYSEDFLGFDTNRMKLYSLGDYFILKSVLWGPQGRSSNYHYVILFNKYYTRYVWFQNLSSTIETIRIANDTLFIDLFDYNNDDYYKGVYYECDTCKYEVYKAILSTDSFTLDTIRKTDTLLALEEIFRPSDYE